MTESIKKEFAEELIKLIKEFHEVERCKLLLTEKKIKISEKTFVRE